MTDQQSASDAARIRQLEDRIAIVDVLHRYCDGIRLGDTAAIASCFTDNATTDQALGRELVRGREAIREYFSPTRTTGLNRPRDGEDFDERVGTTPVVSNVRITLDGDAAQCEYALLVFHVGYKNGDGKIIVRYCRNTDEFTRTSDGWQVNRRVHRELWRSSLPGFPVAEGALGVLGVLGALPNEG
jgi:ketosteroid isomerase-like protein